MKSPWLLILFGTALACPDDPLCRSCTGPHNTCASCSYSVLLPSGQCEPSIEEISNCDQYEINEGEISCKACSLGYYSNGKTCEKCLIGNCAICDSNPMICTACFGNFLIERNICGTSKSTLKACSVPIGNDYCALCVNGFAIGKSKLCIQAPMSCLKLDEISGLCLECKNGFFITSEGLCSEAPRPKPHPKGWGWVIFGLFSAIVGIAVALYITASRSRERNDPFYHADLSP